MSDTTPFMGDDLDVTGPDPGVAADDGLATEAPAAQPRTYLDADAYHDQFVKVKVDGQDHEVPLGEALAGYSRTADYTRKTQELAQQRQEADFAIAVQRALQSAPEQTLRLLAENYGVTLGQAQAAQQAAAPSYYDDDLDSGYQDPIERRLAAIEQQNRAFSEAQAQREADARLQQAVGGLRSRFQLDDAGIREVVTTALQQGRGPESFEVIYKAMAFDKAMAARQLAEQRQIQANGQRQQAAQQASQLVGTGSSAAQAGGTPPASSTGHPMTIAEAFAAAEQQHGSPFA